ncbi:MAG: Holliday junction resolvase [Gammaproteobacteria bacterium]|nr:Holliday junction resolvase [Gammaproteobacteria bacterium]
MSVVTYLCFDYGTRRIGVAVGQTLTATASPLATIRVVNGIPDWRGITALVRQWQPQALVVGLPVTMTDDNQPLTAKAEKFARQLAGRYRIPVHRAEERLTTYAAKHRLKRTTDLDPVAAQIILESWLQENAERQVVSNAG